MHRHVGAAAHGDTDIGGGQGRGVIDAVADHRHHAGLFQLGDGGGLVGGKDFGVYIIDTQGIGHHAGTAAIVAGEQMAADVPGLELCHRLQGAGLERIAKGEQPQHAGLRALFDQPG